MSEVLLVLFFLSPLFAVASWGGTLWFGFGEIGPRWLVPVVFGTGVISVLYFFVYGLLWLTGAIDPPTLTVEFK